MAAQEVVPELTRPAPVTLREFDEIFETVKNWGRWGPEDELGTLNYITPDAVRAVTAVGQELTRDARYLRLATRICAELGAHLVKTYYCEPGFDTVAAACPVPLVMAGGRKLPERDALAMAHHAIENGAAGVDMDRNIFQGEAPEAMIRAVGAVVHEFMKPEDAFDQYVRG